MIADNTGSNIGISLILMFYVYVFQIVHVY